MIPPGGVLRRIVITFAILGVVLAIPLLFVYDVIKVNWRSNMEVQIRSAAGGPAQGCACRRHQLRGAQHPEDR